jgi:uncharacterized protein YkwD
MRRFLLALSAAALLGVLFGCGSETTNQRAQGPEPTFQFTPRSTENTRRTSQPALKGVTNPLPPNTAPKIPNGPVGPADPQFDTNLVRMLNEQRSKKNQPPLSFNPTLTRAAQEQAKLLSQGKQMDLNKAAERLKEAGYKFVTLSMTNAPPSRELNAAAAYAAVAQQEIMMKPEFRDIGIAVDADAANNYHIAILVAAEQKQ